MERGRAERLLFEQADAVKSLGARSLYLFGSTARGTARHDSDLDVFVDHDPSRKFSLLDLAQIKLLLEDRIGVAVDVTTRDGLHPAIREGIVRSARRIF